MLRTSCRVGVHRLIVVGGWGETPSGKKTPIEGSRVKLPGRKAPRSIAQTPPRYMEQKSVRATTRKEGLLHMYWRLHSTSCGRVHAATAYGLAGSVVSRTQSVPLGWGPGLPPNSGPNTV